MKKGKIALEKKLFLNKERIAELNGDAIAGGAVTNGADCMTPPYTVAFQTVCCKSWPPHCSNFIPCLG